MKLFLMLLLGRVATWQYTIVAYWMANKSQAAEV
jgi:hypothetical protein